MLGVDSARGMVFESRDWIDYLGMDSAWSDEQPIGDGLALPGVEATMTGQRTILKDLGNFEDQSRAKGHDSVFGKQVTDVGTGVRAGANRVI